MEISKKEQNELVASISEKFKDSQIITYDYVLEFLNAILSEKTSYDNLPINVEALKRATNSTMEINYIIQNSIYTKLCSLASTEIEALLFLIEDKKSVATMVLRKLGVTDLSKAEDYLIDAFANFTGDENFNTFLTRYIMAKVKGTPFQTKTEIEAESAKKKAAAIPDTSTKKKKKKKRSEIPGFTIQRVVVERPNPEPKVAPAPSQEPNPVPPIENVPVQIPDKKTPATDDKIEVGEKPVEAPKEIVSLKTSETKDEASQPGSQLVAPILEEAEALGQTVEEGRLNNDLDVPVPLEYVPPVEEPVHHEEQLDTIPKEVPALNDIQLQINSTILPKTPPQEDSSLKVFKAPAEDESTKHQKEVVIAPPPVLEDFNPFLECQKRCGTIKGTGKPDNLVRNSQQIALVSIMGPVENHLYEMYLLLRLGFINKSFYTKEEIATILGISIAEIIIFERNTWNTIRQALNNTFSAYEEYLLTKTLPEQTTRS